MAAFIFRKAPEELPEVKFLDAEGKERTLAHWRGKVVLLNLWATWCLPCRKEMPALDRLQAEMGSDKFQVVAVSVDRTGLRRRPQVPRRDQDRQARPLCRSDRAPGNDAARGGPTRDAPSRCPGSRGRPPAWPRRMGQRRRQAPDRRSDQVKCACPRNATAIRDRTPTWAARSRPAAGRRRWRG